MEGGSNIDGDKSGGTSPSQQGAGTGILVPQSLLAMAAEIGIASGKSTSILGVSTPRDKYRRRGASRGPTGQPGGPLARPRVGLRQGPFWSPCGGPPSLLWCFRRLPGL